MLAALALLAPACRGGGDGGAVTGLGVATLERTFVDEARDRTLRTVVTFPDGEGGPFPVVLLSHGLGGRPEMFREFASELASRGYVAAAPEYPVTTSGSWNDVLDVNNQPADASFVLDSVLRLERLEGLVDAEHVAAAGHSLGGITTMLLGFHPCCRDERLDAAVVWAGAALFGTGEGRYFRRLEEPVPPLLMVHGDDDALVRYPLGRTAYRGAPAPKYLLTLLGGDHVLSFFGTDPARDVVWDATFDFLDGTLKGDDDALDRLRREAEVEGVSTLESAMS